MIVRVKNTTAGKWEGYLALRCTAEGHWAPITGKVVTSADQAIRQCTHHARQRLARLKQWVEQSVRTIDKNLDCLNALPEPQDVIRVHGQDCHVDADGALLIPPLLPTGRQRLYTLPDLIDDEMYNVLRTALKLRHKRERAVAVMMDHVLEEPVKVLVRVAESQPEKLGAVAELIVRLFRESEADSPDSGDDAGAGSDA